jgi:hypothetical protein
MVETVMMRRIALLLACLMLASVTALAQTYPSKPVASSTRSLRSSGTRGARLD